MRRFLDKIPHQNDKKTDTFKVLFRGVLVFPDTAALTIETPISRAFPGLFLKIVIVFYPL